MASNLSNLVFTLSRIRPEHVIHLPYFQIQRSQRNSRSLHCFYMLVVASRECLVVLWYHLWQLGNFLNEFTRIQWKRFTKHHGNTKQNFRLFIIYLTGTSKYICFFLEPLKVPLITIRTSLEANGWKRKEKKTLL